MSTVVFIGDELTATGFALAGASARTPAPDAIDDALERAREEADLIVITAEYARHADEERLQRALLAVRPPTVIVPDVRERAAPPDLGARWRGQLEMDL